MTRDYTPLLNPASIDAALIKNLQTAYEESGGLAAAFKVAAQGQGWSPVTVTYISDNGGYDSDLAKGEIRKRLKDIDAIVSTVSGKAPSETLYHDIPSQDWRAGAVDLAQLARDTVRGAGNVIFVNCAPRLKQRGVDTNNKGEDVYVGQLRNGTVVAGVSEHSFAFFRDLVDEGDLELHRVKVQTDGSQFRSRDYFPWFAKILAHNLAENAGDWKAGQDAETRRDFLSRFTFVDTTDSLSADAIPDLTKDIAVARVDTHGNLKLSISASDIKPEWLTGAVEITVKGKTFQASFGKNMFDTASGIKSASPGSSGHWPDSGKDDPRFVELAIIGGNLRQEVGLTDEDLKNGVAVKIVPLKQETPVFNVPQQPVFQQHGLGT